MQKDHFNIEPYSDKVREQVLKVWENSVLATHDFLSPNDFREIKELVSSINFNQLDVFCLINGNIVSGFIGVAEKKIEMLFLDSQIFGKGLGLQLLNFAVKELKANKVDVNEQNVKAVKFYQKSGFEIFARTDQDDQGRKYPLLRMKLKI
ncbi:GNAT family N-acetyltransferase [Chryseobacterium binzhouense]|uniref:GNAT family N-acetyltransferase n=1 Tax=Chryseobacterium binzhouense TaxID=2593646 RepID=UPI00289A0F1D|nr:GNAT family N-acetyltransferase [Chryseobacterium binzhouense]